MSSCELKCISSTVATAVEIIGKTNAGYLDTPGDDFKSMFHDVAYGADDSTFKSMYSFWIPKLAEYQKLWNLIRKSVIVLRNNNLIGTAVDLNIIYDNNGSSVLLSDSDIDMINAIDQYYMLYLKRPERSAGGYKDTNPSQPQEKAAEQPSTNEDNEQTEEKEKQQQERKEAIQEGGKISPGIQEQAHLNNRTTAEQPQNFKAAEYVPVLCRYFNQATRSSTKTPQIPVSVLVSITLARTGFEPERLQHFD